MLALDRGIPPLDIFRVLIVVHFNVRPARPLLLLHGRPKIRREPVELRDLSARKRLDLDGHPAFRARALVHGKLIGPHRHGERLQRGKIGD